MPKSKLRKPSSSSSKMKMFGRGGKSHNSKSGASTNPFRVSDGAKKAANLPTNKLRSKSTINRLNMYRSKPNEAKRKAMPTKPVRIQPDRRWFGNVRVITEGKLEEFREEMSKSSNDPYSVVLKRSTLPISLLKDSTKESRMQLLSIEPFDEVFGSKKRRKKPKMEVSNFEEMLKKIEDVNTSYNAEKDKALAVYDEMAAADGTNTLASDEVFKKGTSKRIWAELYKVIDSADVLVQVLDARDPMGTRCKQLETKMKKERAHKHMILLMNKSDLIPSWAASRWVKILSKEYPTLAFHASLTKPFGKQSLIQLFRQFAGLLKDKKNISVGFFGYPNVGKSSVINALRRKKVCKSAPIPGETRVWQYVTLTNRIYLIDCPGIVPVDPDNGDTAKVLKGAIRPERIQSPEKHIDEVLARAKREDLIKRYGLGKDAQFEDAMSFLEAIALKMGKLLKGGEPDISTSARIVLYDWQRGRIPFFVPPPTSSTTKGDSSNSGVRTPHQSQPLPTSLKEPASNSPSKLDEEGENLEDVSVGTYTSSETATEDVCSKLTEETEETLHSS